MVFMVSGWSFFYFYNNSLVYFIKLLHNIIMKKRLRKKKKLGEFIEWGALVQAGLIINSSAGLDEFSDEFIEKVEALECYCGGGISIDRGLDMVIELGVDKSRASVKLKDLENWLVKHPLVSAVHVLGVNHSGSMDRVFDLWHEEPQGIEY